MNAALILIPSTPFVMTGLVMIPGPTRPWFIRLAPLAALPAIVVALLVTSVDTTTVPWLLLDTRVGLDTTTRVFLLFSGLIWGVAGWYAHRYLEHEVHEARFHAFFLLAMSGNLGLIVAQDVVSFYASFALMTFSSAGLIVHDATRLAFRATSVYVILAIIGEFLLLVGLFQAAMAAGSVELSFVPEAVAADDGRDWTILFLLAGFGIKAGLPLLHIWLPLAHPAAPTPASAVLSGVMIKAGLLGWMRFLPIGADDLATWGWACVAIGATATFGGVLIGLVQQNAKVALAYSSVSQMGIMTMALGLGLMDASAWPAIVTVLLLYAMHHGMAKGALFLSVGVADSVARHPRARILLFVGVVIAALALAGAPLTSGSIAKAALKDEVYSAGQWSTAMEWIVALSSTATTLLMVRFLTIMARETRVPTHVLSAGLWAPWMVLVGGVLVATWTASAVFDLGATGGLMNPGHVWDATWPVALGMGIGAVGWRLRQRLAPAVGAIPPGDVVVVAEAMFRRVVRPGVAGMGAYAGRATLQWSQFSNTVGGWIGSEKLMRGETRLASWQILGIVLLSIMLGLMGLLSWQT